MVDKVILFGLTQTADIIEFYLKKYTDIKICARCVDKEYLNVDSYNNMPVVAFEDVANLYSPTEYKFAIPMMNMDLNRVRENKYKLAKEKGYKFISYISPISTVETTDIG